MKRNTAFRSFLCCSLAGTALFVVLATSPAQVGAKIADDSSKRLPMNQLGAVATKQYEGDDLSVIATPGGARLCCAFQRLEGEVTRDGLWLRSTAGVAQGEHFRVMAVEVGRTDDFGVRRQSGAATPLFEGEWIATAVADSETVVALGFPPQSKTLPVTGAVLVNGQTVRYIRDRLTEEYSVSVDGVRQDFIVDQRPEGDGELRVELAVTGAKAEPLVSGVRLVLTGSGRKLDYNRLRVLDAAGRELPARMEVSFAGDEVASLKPCNKTGNSVEEMSLLTSSPTSRRSNLAVMVDDANAVYPVRIDPTFSDADWVSMGGFPGVHGTVYASVQDAFGNLYVGGAFTVAGGVLANRIAKWNGSAWSAIGSGLGGSNAHVAALAISGSNLFVGGYFTTAGGISATNIARWDGASWFPLGSGLNNRVQALAVSDTNLYAGGEFTKAGGVSAVCIAKWNGSTWTGLGGGLNDYVYALAVSDTNLYAGGAFTTAGGAFGVSASRIAKWNGSTWSSLGSGMQGGIVPPYVPYVYALAVSGTNLYAGGTFTSAGGGGAQCVAKWNGSSWSAVGAGMNGEVKTLAFSGTNLYAGGAFQYYIAKLTGNSWLPLGPGPGQVVRALAVSADSVYAGGDFINAAGVGARGIARWDGVSWSALGLGMNGSVYALGVSDGQLYAGGIFARAGRVTAHSIARWDGSSWSALGSGVGGQYPYVDGLAVSGSNLYVGGWFTTARCSQREPHRQVERQYLVGSRIGNG